MTKDTIHITARIPKDLKGKIEKISVAFIKDHNPNMNVSECTRKALELWCGIVSRNFQEMGVVFDD